MSLQELHAIVMLVAFLDARLCHGWHVLRATYLCLGRVQDEMLHELVLALPDKAQLKSMKLALGSAPGHCIVTESELLYHPGFLHLIAFCMAKCVHKRTGLHHWLVQARCSLRPVSGASQSSSTRKFRSKPCSDEDSWLKVDRRSNIDKESEVKFSNTTASFSTR
eukprot:3271271-Amphidinium_carterae.1